LSRSEASGNNQMSLNTSESLFSKRKVLVTGGGGFIGSHLTHKLYSLGAKIVIVDPTLSSFEIFEPKQPSVRVENLFLDEYIGRTSTNLSAFDFVFHLAGNATPVLSVEKPAMDFEQNLVNTFLLLDALRTSSNPPKLINMSSAAVYGNPASIPINEIEPTLPLSPYGISKLAAERYSTVFCSLYGLRTVNVRPFSVYGPGLKKQVVYDTLQKLQNDPKRLQIYGDGQQERDFVYISDLIDALLLIAAKAPARGEVYNIASGTSTTINEVIDTICKLKKIHPQKSYSGKTRPGEPLRWKANIEKIRSLGFSAKITLGEGLRETIKWFEKQTNI
jgi:UDP-glucose 4-epimerase